MNVKISDNKDVTEINWDKPQLLESNGLDTDRTVVLYTGNHQNHSFSGVSLFNPNYTQGWLKQDFKPFNGTITLSND